MDDPARRDLLIQVRDEARHLDGMVRNLLSMTRLEAGGLDLRRDWIDIGESLDRAVGVVKKRGAGQSFDIEAEAELPLVYADQSLVDQALGNVLANAVRYAGDTACVRLSASRDGDTVRIRISDDGPGVSAEIASQVFEKFARANPGSAKASESAGLGLAITKGIVETHGGSVELETPAASPLGGASFVLCLPIDNRSAS